MHFTKYRRQMFFQHGLRAFKNKQLTALAIQIDKINIRNVMNSQEFRQGNGVYLNFLSFFNERYSTSFATLVKSNRTSFITQCQVSSTDLYERAVPFITASRSPSDRFRSDKRRNYYYCLIPRLRKMKTASLDYLPRIWDIWVNVPKNSLPNDQRSCRISRICIHK